ncbi:MAG: HAMP domain-containing sensor histidine kinase [Acidimicrobiia bacterium]|nr:HAMP domain-containing sensor histidine kinase [Acidimicrobiia bacterium]MDJ0664275.1 HAMP domain-containing sensor histidine kinase [Acidimicrobiia bacterium]
MDNPAKRRLFVLALVILVVGSGVAAALLDAASYRAEVATWTQGRSEVVESVVQDLLDDAFDDLEAMAAYITYGSPSPASFQSFVDHIEGTSNSIGIGYLDYVPADQAEAHIAERRATLGEFYDFLGLAPETAFPEPLDRTGRTEFYPIQLFAFGDLIRPLLGDDVSIPELGLGLDAGYNPAWRALVTTAIKADGRNLSSFFGIEAASFRFDRLFFASVPVGPDGGEPIGVVASVMLEPLLLANAETRILDDVQWEVVPIGGAPERIQSANVSFFDLDVPNAPWRLAVAPTDEALAELEGRPPWTTGLAVAVAMTLAAVSLWLFVDRRRERNRSVNLKALAEEKDRFLATVSHELRTPLTVVSGLANEIRDRPLDFEPDEIGTLHSMIVDETDELSAIVEDLLIAARSDISSVTVASQPVDVMAELEVALRVVDAVPKVSGDPAIALADPQRVRQILRNLFTNAIRYGGDEVRVEVSVAGPWVETIVSDNGEGIPAAKRELVFEPYESAHASRNGTGSVGLGLYVSRALARAMNGDLDYTRRDQWSHFRLRLPAVDSRTEQQDSPRPVASIPG